MRVFLTLLLLPILASCRTIAMDYREYLMMKEVNHPEDFMAFQHCHGYGCRHIADISLSPRDWQEIDDLFHPPSADAAQERERIAEAIGLLEVFAGGYAGTDGDVKGTFYSVGAGQLDCVDESTNTTVYLALLKKAKLMRYHEIGAPNTRIPLVNYLGRWPHQTAVIIETANGAEYAVDSWFHDNGHRAEIVPMKQWKAGWKPDKG